MLPCVCVATIALLQYASIFLSISLHVISFHEVLSKEFSSSCNEGDMSDALLSVLLACCNVDDDGAMAATVSSISQDSSVCNSWVEGPPSSSSQDCAIEDIFKEAASLQATSSEREAV